MALTKNTLPSIGPTRAVPFDALLNFGTQQTLTATGYMAPGAVTSQLAIGPGRFDGYWVVDVSAIDVSSGDETYRLFLLGSNDAAFGNGNVEMLDVIDYSAATAGRLIPTICPPSDAIPETGRFASRKIKLISNQLGAYVFQYFQMYAVIGGTTPSITIDSWISPNEC